MRTTAAQAVTIATALVVSIGRTIDKYQGMTLEGFLTWRSHVSMAGAV